MKQSYTLTPEELFFMAKLMKASYIDYEYIQLMQDISQRFKLIQREVLRSLENKKLLEEDFSGEIELSPEGQKILHPIFFGEAESDIKIDEITHKFHFEGDDVTYVLMKGKQLHIQKGTIEDVRKLAETIAPESYKADQMIIDKRNLRGAKAEKVVTVRNRVVSQTANAMEIVKISGAWYAGATQTKSILLSREDIHRICEKWLWEE